MKRSWEVMRCNLSSRFHARDHIHTGDSIYIIVYVVRKSNNIILESYQFISGIIPYFPGRINICYIFFRS